MQERHSLVLVVEQVTQLWSQRTQLLPESANPLRQLVQAVAELQVAHPTGQTTGTPPTVATATFGVGLTKHDPLVSEYPLMQVVQAVAEVQAWQ